MYNFSDCSPSMIVTKGLTGFVAVFMMAVIAYAATQIPFLSKLHPMVIALLLGIAIGNFFNLSPQLKPGIAFCQKTGLRLAVALLGIQISFSEIADVGITGFSILATALITTFLFTIFVGRKIGVDERLCELIASGTAVCGASAIVATNTVTRALEEDVAYAIASVTLFGSISMVLYPTLLPLLSLSPHSYGLWAGASIHEVGQVAAAAFQGGLDAGTFGTTSKLVRVIMLPLLVMAIGWWGVSRTHAKLAGSKGHVPPAPLFVLGFIGFVTLNSIVEFNAEIRGIFSQATIFLMTMALAAIGLATDISKLRLRGIRPFILGLSAWIFISSSTLALVMLVY